MAKAEKRVKNVSRRATSATEGPTTGTSVTRGQMTQEEVDLVRRDWEKKTPEGQTVAILRVFGITLH